jgi:hypothetical protein
VVLNGSEKLKEIWREFVEIDGELRIRVVNWDDEEISG